MSNSAQARAAAAYGRAAQTASPAHQIVMLYDGAVRRLREARAAVLAGRIEERYHLVQKVAAIIDALHGCLDFERGGEIAGLLDRYYTYVSFRLQQINVRNDPAICDELIERLSELRASWQRIADGTAAPSAAAPIGSGDRASLRT